MDLMPRAGTASPPSPMGGGGEARPVPPHSVTPPSQTFGFPFVPLRAWRWPDAAALHTFSLPLIDGLMPAVGTDGGTGFSGSEELDR